MASRPTIRENRRIGKTGVLESPRETAFHVNMSAAVPLTSTLMPNLTYLCLAMF